MTEKPYWAAVAAAAVGLIGVGYLYLWPRIENHMAKEKAMGTPHKINTSLSDIHEYRIQFEKELDPILVQWRDNRSEGIDDILEIDTEKRRISLAGLEAELPSAFEYMAFHIRPGEARRLVNPVLLRHRALGPVKNGYQEAVLVNAYYPGKEQEGFYLIFYPNAKVETGDPHRVNEHHFAANLSSYIPPVRRAEAHLSILVDPKYVPKWTPPGLEKPSAHGPDNPVYHDWRHRSRQEVLQASQVNAARPIVSVQRH